MDVKKELKLKTTKKHFEIFKAECQKWIDFFGLYEYSINFKHKKIIERGQAFAKINTSEYWCIFTLNIEWYKIETTEEEIKKSAFHEVCHLLLERLVYCGTCRYTTEEEIISSVESIIKRMENCVFEKLAKKLISK